MRRFCPKNCLQVINRLVVINEQHSIFEQIANFTTGQNPYTRLNITYIMRRCRYGKTEGGKGAERRLGRRRIPYRPETDVTFSVDLTDRFFLDGETFFRRRKIRQPSLPCRECHRMRAGRFQFDFSADGVILKIDGGPTLRAGSTRWQMSRPPRWAGLIEWPATRRSGPVSARCGEMRSG